MINLVNINSAFYYPLDYSSVIILAQG